MIGLGEALIIGGVVVLIFGATQIPKLARSMGQGFREFKKAVRDAKEDSPEHEAGAPAADSDGGDKKE